MDKVVLEGLLRELDGTFRDLTNALTDLRVYGDRGDEVRIERPLLEARAKVLEASDQVRYLTWRDAKVD